MRLREENFVDAFRRGLIKLFIMKDEKSVFASFRVRYSNAYLARQLGSGQTEEV